MMNLDEAIQHCEEVAEENEEIYEAHCRIYSKEVVEKYPSPPCKKCAEEHRQLAEWLKELKAYRNKSEIPTSCGDAISRQAVEKITWEEPTFTDALNVLAEVRDKVRALPSVSPQQRTGRWIKQNYGWNWQCSECGFVTPPSAKEIFTFCPNCGAKMEVEDAD